MATKNKSTSAKIEQPRKRINPAKAFLVAKAYQQAAHLLHRAYTERTLGPVEVTIGIPQMMLAAFTCEVYMKTIYAIENEGVLVSNKHKLNQLFSRLSSPFKAAVCAEWDKTVVPRMEGIFPPEKRDLYTHLNASQDAFEQLRYFYQYEGQTFHLGDLPAILQKVLLERHPQFNQFGPLFRPAG